MQPGLVQRTESDSPPEDERSDDSRSRAIVPLHPRRRWRDPGPKMVAAVCYFAWLGWVTAPAPLLLLNSRRMRKARGMPYHLFAAAGWSSAIAVFRIGLYALTTWLGTCEGARPEAICNALNMMHLVVVLSFALLFSGWYAVEALLGREISLPPLSRWAHKRARHFLGKH
ncbi:MAG: hypothetical protein GF393_11065 [Armatimonadia bacterium]|nr:hypothetical protein [Armatimonadia bacterium]